MKNKLKFLVALFFVMCCFMGLPVICEADYEDGAECPGCGHYHWDEYMCGNCGYCSDSCTNEACYSENHCNGCDACISDLDWYCPDCWCCADCISEEDHCMYCWQEADTCSSCRCCDDCIDYLNMHCQECGECEVENGTCETDSTLPHCAVCCIKCSECEKCFADDVSDWCEFCGMCYSCSYEAGTLCQSCIVACKENDSFCDTCGICDDCTSRSEFFHCQLCGNCFEEVPECEEFGTGSHCQECCIECDSCGICAAEFLCDECGLCIECCMANAEAEGCTCGEYCVLDSDFEDHRCEICGSCVDSSDRCEFCDLCFGCCEELMCEHGVCEADEDGMAEHTCVDCGDCFYESDLCEYCDEVRCLNCCAEISSGYGCDHEICIESDMWSEHFCEECGVCIEETCSICDGCYICCEEAKDAEGCDHDFTCPNDSGWDEHFCDDCGECFEDDERCFICGLCLECCAAVSEAEGCSCGEPVCVEDIEWLDHFCNACGECFEVCDHGVHTHTFGSTYSHDKTYHFNKCTICGNELSKGKHSVITIMDIYPTATTKGSCHTECTICGYKSNFKEVSPVATHTCTYTVQKMTSTHHWLACKVCGNQKPGSYGKHAMKNNACMGCVYSPYGRPTIVTAPRDVIAKSSDEKVVFTIGAEEGTIVGYTWILKDGNDELFREETTLPQVIIDLSKLSGLECGGKYTLSCEVHGKVYTTTSNGKNATLTVQHSISKNYKSDENYHWRSCTGCNLAMTTDKEKHITNGTSLCTVCKRVLPPVIKNQSDIVNVKYSANNDVTAKLFVTVYGSKNANVLPSLSGTHIRTDNLSNKTQTQLDKANTTNKLNTINRLNNRFNTGSTNNKITIGNRRPVSETLEEKRKLANPDYQWYYDKDGKNPVSDGDNISGSKTSVLSVKIDKDMCLEQQNDPNSFTFYCKVTNTAGSTMSKAMKIKVAHNDNGKYESTNAKHWQVCSCGSKFNEAGHNFGKWVVSVKATETKKGANVRTCLTCGYKETEEVPVVTRHEHTFGSYSQEGNYHKRVCSECKYVEAELHTYDNGVEVDTKKNPLTNEEVKHLKYTCTLCGYTKTTAKNLAADHWSNASEWAISHLNKALSNNLLPSTIDGEDLTKPVTRREFAAIAVKMYEKLTGNKAEAAKVNPFTDTKDSDVLKAYNIGITAGTSATTFEPNSQITREQMAVMMTNAVRKAMPNEKTNMTETEISAKFADHQNIAGWAVSGVYYMSGKGIISGMGDNMFGAKGTATREQAMTISVKSIDALK